MDASGWLAEGTFTVESRRVLLLRYSLSQSSKSGQAWDLTSSGSVTLVPFCLSCCKYTWGSPRVAGESFVLRGLQETKYTKLHLLKVQTACLIFKVSLMSHPMQTTGFTENLSVPPSPWRASNTVLHLIGKTAGCYRLVGSATREWRQGYYRTGDMVFIILEDGFDQEAFLAHDDTCPQLLLFNTVLLSV